MKMKKWTKNVFMLGIITVFIALPVMSQAKQLVIKLGHADPEDVYTSKKGAAARVFKDIVEAESSGAIQVKVFPSGQIGGERELIESTKLGTIQMCLVSGPVAGYFKPAMVFDIPYLFSSAPVAWKVLDGPFGKNLSAALLKKSGLRNLAYGETGFRNFTNSKRPIKSPADMNGLKIRVMETPLYITMVKALGAAPTPISWPEVYTSLQQGVVDGQENPVSVILYAKFSEVQKYLTLDGHAYGTDFFLFNDMYFKKMSPEHQALIKRAGIIAANVGRSIQQLGSAMGVAKLAEMGMEVYAPTSEEKEEFKKMTQKPVIEWMKGQVEEVWINDVLKAVKEAEAELAE